MSKRRFFPGWSVVAGSGVGIAFSSVVFISQTFSLISATIGAQFGWSQAQLANGASIFLLLQIVMYPACGWALDRWGSRKVGSISIVLFAISLAVLSQIGSSLSEFYLSFLLIGLFGTGTNAISYTRAITLWFKRKRGLALGLATSCQALGAILMPIFTQKIIVASGWPTALLVLAGVELVICLPFVALLVKDDPKAYGWRPDGAVVSHQGERPTTPGEGPELSVIVRSANFWKVAVAFAIMGMSFYAWITNVAFILTKSAGMSLAEVATVQATLGIAFFVGRIFVGYLLDKFHAPIVAVALLVLAGVFYTIWGATASPTLIFIGGVLGGISASGEGDLLPYLAGRYFGKHAVSKVFGWFLCAYAVGAAIGPVAFARATAVFNGPAIPLYILAVLQIIPAMLFLSLGAYRGAPRAEGPFAASIGMRARAKISSEDIRQASGSESAG